MKRIFLIILILSLSKYGEAIDIRIGIINGVESVSIEVPGYVEIIDLSTNRDILTAYGWKDNSIKVTDDGLKIKDMEVMSDHFLLRPIVGAKAVVNGNRYRGKIEIARNGNKIKVINIIELEEYLYGVLKNEMSDKAPIESLKAQAVIARTFALANLKKHEKKDGYNLCPKIHCQVYKGMDTETDNVIKAVNDTNGQILTYNGVVAETFYYAWCAGVTASSKLVWGREFSYLTEIYDPFCKKKYPNDEWKWTLSLNEIKDILNRNGQNIGDISSIQSGSKATGGRVNEIIITHTNGISTISANKFRLLAGSDKIWSTIFTIISNGNRVTFQGKGKGHGVGLCQRGAVAMGELGYNYKQILGFYYPGLYLSSIISEEE